jgi:chloride intracellular channel protein 2
VAGIIENVYSKFKLMLIKRDEASKNSLVAQLTRINDHMEATGSRFLTGQVTACWMARQTGWSETSLWTWIQRIRN